jgi:hypothetical protein
VKLPTRAQLLKRIKSLGAQLRELRKRLGPKRPRGYRGKWPRHKSHPTGYRWRGKHRARPRTCSHKRCPGVCRHKPRFDRCNDRRYPLHWRQKGYSPRTANRKAAACRSRHRR